MKSIYEYLYFQDRRVGQFVHVHRVVRHRIVQYSWSRQSQSLPAKGFFWRSPTGRLTQISSQRCLDRCKTCCGEIYLTKVAFAGPFTYNEDEWFC
jgi:hypothetical protein